MQRKGTTKLIGGLFTKYRTDWKVRLVCRLTLIGLVYGYISALHNQNPYYPVPQSAAPEKFWLEIDISKCPEYASRAWDWRPSPVWLPSYLLCKVPGEPGLGISYTRSGYLFRSTGFLILYRCASTVLGGLLGLALGVIIAAIQAGRERAKIPAPDVPGTD